MAVATLVPIEEYLSTSWDPDREYVDGRLIERNVGELDHSYLQGLIANFCDAEARALRIRRAAGAGAGEPVSDTGCSGGSTDPGPPADFCASRRISWSRSFRAKTELVIIDDKIDDYLELGVENIWVVDPRRLRVTIRTRDGGRICRGPVETLDGEFSIPLAEIFEDMPSTEDVPQ